MTPEQLAEILARAEAATPGPWGSYTGGTYADIAADLTMTGRSSYSYRQKIAQLEDEDFWDDPAHEDADESRASEQMAANAVFIANARTDVPALVAEVEALRKQVTELKTALARATASPKDRLCTSCEHSRLFHTVPPPHSCFAAGCACVQWEHTWILPVGSPTPGGAL